MNTITRILKNEYYDSVTLMSLTARLKKEMKPEELVVLMATEINKELMASVGFIDPDLQSLSPNDCVIGVISDSDDSILDTIVEQLKSKTMDTSGSDEKSYSTIDEANADIQGNLCMISAPGQFAAREAAIALEQGMHVLLFSDNITVEDEISLKLTAREKGLLLMGPDCGTAIINGVGLCFANKVSRGSIGLVAASGTGLQEVSVLIDRFGGGISQAIGVGGRDLSEAVGGIMMLEGIKALSNDSATEVIVLISKPPAKSVYEKILLELKQVVKPVVICFLDGDVPENSDVIFTTTLAEAASEALKLSHIKVAGIDSLTPEMDILISKNRRPGKFLRGLYCGGTLCAEALSLSRSSLPSVTSNVAKRKEEKMPDLTKSSKHCFVDLGDDFFTNGRPHPMIEPTIRLERILQEAKDEETGVILLDFELGFGSHPDPVGVTAETIEEAMVLNPDLVFVGYICGTSLDSQNLNKQEKTLSDLGVLIAQSNSQAVQLAINLIKE